MFCPKCKAEYREGFSRCAVCDVDLAPELPPEPEQSITDVAYIDLFSIKTYWNRHEAELEKGFLSSNGIHAVVSADDCGGTRPELSFSRGVRLLVKEEDVERAKEALNDDSYGTPIKRTPRFKKKPLTPFLSKTFTWSFLIAIVGFVGIVVEWVAGPENMGITPLESVLLSFWGLAELAWFITLGVIAHRLGRRWLVWTGFSFATGPIGHIVAYVMMLGHMKEARNSQISVG